MQSVPITTNVMSLNTARAAILDAILCDKGVSDFRQVADFLRVLRFPPPIELATMT
jgi:hypothetical protein